MELTEYIDKNLVHSIHTSERRSFRSCRRRWNWAYKDLLYPVVTPRALEFGVAFHKAMEVFYEPQLWGKDPETQMYLALKAFRDECDSQLRNYKRLNGEPEVDTLKDYRERLDLGLNMIRFYCEDVSPSFDKGFRPVDVEVPFEVAIVDPQGNGMWCKCDQCWKKQEFFWQTRAKAIAPTRNEWSGLPVTYGGRLDMLAQDDNGKYWIFDWKTTSRILNEGMEESFLELDDQIASYCWALRALGIPVAGFVYVEIKKAYPQPPEELTRTYKGRRYSTNKQFLTTHDIYRRHVTKNDPDGLAAGLYDEHLAWLKVEGPKFHQRHQIHKNQHELDEIGKNIYLEASDMVSNPRVYPTPGRFSCPTCSYRQPCLGMNMGEDYEYTISSLFEKRERHYYEERERSTE